MAQCRLRNDLATLAFATLLQAAVLPASAAGLFDKPADDARLDAVRGGFAPPGGGLIVSIGVQRAVFIDGAPVAAAVDGAKLLLVQRGAGNAVGSSFDAAGAAIVVQNTLDHQQIQAVTTYDIVANSLQLYRAGALQSGLRASLLDALRR